MSHPRPIQYNSFGATAAPPLTTTTMGTVQSADYCFNNAQIIPMCSAAEYAKSQSPKMTRQKKGKKSAGDGSTC